MQNLNQKHWLTRLLDRVPDYLTLSLIVMCGSLLARLTWLMFPADPDLLARTQAQQQLAATEQVQVIQARAPQVNEGSEVARFHLFGQVQTAGFQTEAPVLAANPPVATRSREPIELVGVYALKGKDGLAILKVKGQQKVFKVDEVIKLKINNQEENLGAVLLEVTDKTATIDWGNNEHQVLKMANHQVSKQGAILNNDMPPLPNTMVGLPMEQGITNFDPAVMPMGDAIDMPQPGILKQGDFPQEIIPLPSDVEPVKEAVPEPVSLRQFRDQAIADNSRLLDVLVASPALANGKMSGFQVSPGKNLKLFQASGLFTGDIVTEVNGMPLTDMASGMQVLQSLSKASTVKLKVLRGGSEIVVERSF